MLLKIRNSCFETNSSSSHALGIVTEEDFNKWKSGILYFDGTNMVSKEKVMEEYKKALKDQFEDYEDVSFEDFVNGLSDWYVAYTNATESRNFISAKYTLEDGKKIVAFAYEDNY